MVTKASSSLSLIVEKKQAHGATWLVPCLPWSFGLVPTPHGHYGLRVAPRPTRLDAPPHAHEPGWLSLYV